MPNIFVAGYFGPSSFLLYRPTFPRELEALSPTDSGHGKHTLAVVLITIESLAPWPYVLEGCALYPDSGKSLGADGATAGSDGEFFWFHYGYFILAPR